MKGASLGPTKNSLLPNCFKKFPVIAMGAISLKSKFKPCGSSNSWDMKFLQIEDGHPQ